MTKNQHNSNRHFVFIRSKSLVVLVLLLVIVSLSGWSYLTNKIETGPYQFIYPANFGNRINVPDDNPTTKQGVYLGRMLFYE